MTSQVPDWLAVSSTVTCRSTVEPPEEDRGAAATAPEPSWWRTAPRIVASALSELPGLASDTPIQLAVGPYCSMAARVYHARVLRRKFRLRPSASTELEPSRVLTVHAEETGWLGEAHCHCSASDGEDAWACAVAALSTRAAQACAVVRLACGTRQLEVQAQLLTRRIGATLEEGVIHHVG